MGELAIRLAFPSTSFPMPFSPPAPYARVEPSQPPAVDHTQNVAEGAPEQLNGVWTQKWGVSPASQNEIDSRTTTQAGIVRRRRNALLSECDWTQMADSPVAGDTSWLQYRQALRDLTSQAGFPWSVTWPVAP